MDKVGGALDLASKAHTEAMKGLKDGTQKGRTIIGRLEKIKTLGTITNKSIPPKHLNEIELLPDDDMLLLDSGISYVEEIREIDVETPYAEEISDENK
jgi:hypothetical protein